MLEFALFVRLLDMGATFVFALSGAIAAARKRFDPVGFLILSAVAAIGGGTLRDVMLGRTPVAWLSDGATLGAVALAAGIVFFAGERIAGRLGALRWADAAGLAFAAAAGVIVAQKAGLAWPGAILMGVMSGCFGGLLRDALCGETPFIFRGEIYATAAAAGAAAQAGLGGLGAPMEAAALIGAAITFGLRAIAIRRHLTLPSYERKPPA